MDSPGGSAPLRGFAVLGIALAGLAFAYLPAGERLDDALLDAQWKVLRRFDVRPAPDEIVLVGIDEATVAQVREPKGLWHDPLGRVLARIAAGRPKAIGLDLPLPERSFDDVRPGLDRVLMAGLAAARDSGPLVATLSIDARTRAARPIHAPFLAVLGDEGLGLGLLSRDPDGVTRRFSLTIPTEDGAFPTFEGRLCRALARRCDEGYIHFALGAAYRYIPFHRLLDAAEAERLRPVFRDRIVLVGEVQRFGDRIATPVGFAAWEPGGADSPGLVVHAQALRTALQGTAPDDAARPLALVLAALAAIAFLVRDARLAALSALLAAVALFALAVVALRGGLVLPLGGAIAAAALAAAARAGVQAYRRYEIRRR